GAQPALAPERPVGRLLGPGGPVPPLRWQRRGGTGSRWGGAAQGRVLEQLGGVERGGIGVALHLGEGDRAARERAVGEADRVAGVLPALVHETLPGLVEVLQETVTVRIGVLEQPGRGRLERRAQLLERGVLETGGTGRVQQLDPQRRRVDRDRKSVV